MNEIIKWVLIDMDRFTESLVSMLLVNIPDESKTQEMCKSFVEENSGTLVFFPDGWKTQKVCGNAVKNNPWKVVFVPWQVQN